MISDGSNVVVLEGAVEQAECTCCGGETTVVSGHLQVGALQAGWYTVGVTLGRPDHLPLLNLYIGDWSETAGPDERWGLRVSISNDGPKIEPWTEEASAQARPVFSPLQPDQVHATPMEPQIFTLIDRILIQDSRL